MITNTRCFERFQKTNSIIAEQDDDAGRQETAASCLDDIEECWRHGLLTWEQRLWLIVALIREGSFDASLHAGGGPLRMEERHPNHGMRSGALTEDLMSRLPGVAIQHGDTERKPKPPI